MATAIFYFFLSFFFFFFEKKNAFSQTQLRKITDYWKLIRLNVLPVRQCLFFLAVLENSVLPMGRDSQHAKLKVTSESKF